MKKISVLLVALLICIWILPLECDCKKEDCVICSNQVKPYEIRPDY